MKFSFSHSLVFPLSCFLVFLGAATLLSPQENAQVVNLSDPKLRQAVREALNLPSGTPITQQEMLQLTWLKATDIGITDLTGLEYAINLESLDLGGNQIGDISPLTELIQLTWLSLWHNRIQDITPLAKLAKLEFINLTGNSIEDITILTNLTQLVELHLVENQIWDISPLANLIWLETLWLEHNMITDITPLANLTQLEFIHLTDNSIEDITILTNLTQLVELSVAANQIRDISPLANLVRLEKLWLNINAITDITPLIGLKNLKVLHLADNPIHDFAPLAEFEGVELDVEIDLSRLDELSIVVEIPAPNLERAIREVLSLSDGIPLTRGMMLQLTFLSAADKGITDLTGLEHAANLDDLDLGGNQIRDIQPLMNLTNLTHLSLRSNQVQDIAPLANLTNLTYLNLGGNSIENIEPLAGLIRLQTLDLLGNGVKDIAPIANLTSVRVLILTANQVRGLTPLAALSNLEELYVRGNLVNDLTPVQGLNLVAFEYDEVCDIPPLLAPVRERIENRTFPSVYLPWGDVTGLEHLTRDQRIALHDLYWDCCPFPGLGWYGALNFGISTSIGGNLEAAYEVHQRQTAQNPNMIFFAGVSIHQHGSLEAFPPDSDFWLRDASGQILGNQDDQYLINFLKPEVQDLLIKRIIAIERCGFYDGVFFDGFAHNGTGFVGRHLYPATDEEIIQAYTNIFQAVRAQVRDDFLILINTNDSKPTRYTEFINGIWMERIGIFAEYPVVDDIRGGVLEAEDLLSWAQENLRPPQITCLHGAGTIREPTHAPNNRRWMRVFTTLSLTHSDGYVVYDTDYDNVWYPFWDANLGRPIGPKVQLYQNVEGLFIREFTNGWAVYNRSGQAQTIMLPVSATPVSDREGTSPSQTHQLPDLDGEIYLTTKSFADVNDDGRINVLDLVQVANGLGKSTPDPNGDGVVNILDLVFVAQQFSQ